MDTREAGWETQSIRNNAIFVFSIPGHQRKTNQRSQKLAFHYSPAYISKSNF